MKVLCAICSQRKGQRACSRRGKALICPSCCAAGRGSECGECSYYASSVRYWIEKQTTTAETGDYLWYKMRQTEGKLIPVMMEFVNGSFSASIMAEAWDEFMCWPEELPAIENNNEFDAIFIPWFLFNWIAEQPKRRSKKRRVPEKQLALHYLDEHAGELDTFDVQFIEAACRRHYSYYAITDIVPGQALMLRDIFLETSHVVKERAASIPEHRGIILFSRILTIDDTSVMLGAAPTVIPAGYHNQLIDLREAMKKDLGTLTDDFLFDFDVELRQWYWDVKDALSRPPVLHNTDGDIFAMHKLYFMLSCTVQEAFDRLRPLRLDYEDECYADKAVVSGSGELEEIAFEWFKKGNKKIAEWENTIMGHCRLTPGSLRVEVNSVERARKIRRLVSRLLGSAAVYQNEVIETAEELFQKTDKQRAEDTAQPRPRTRIQQSPEMEDVIREIAGRHWASWIDQKIPALGNITPRKASKTKLGREKLEALFVDFETRSNRAGKNPFDPDIAQLRKRLGL